VGTVVVVDDDSVSQRILGYVLGKLGHSVVRAGDGQEALERVAEACPDLIVLDLAMPRMDGLSTLRRLRADDRYQTVPIIMLTGSGLERDERQARAQGVTEFLTKPYPSGQLIQMVERLIGRGGLS